MDEREETTVADKLSPGTISARRLLQGTSLIGFLVATVTLSAETVSVFGIGLAISEELLKGLLTVVLIYLTTGFTVRVVTDLAAALPSRFEIRLRERVARQTEDIKQQTVERLAQLLPSGPGKKFRTQSFESLLDEDVPKRPEYRAAMLNNTIGEIHRWKMQESDPDDPERPFVPAEIEEKFMVVLNELLESHEVSCRRRRVANAPRWAMHWALILLRFTFFDALAPLLISVLVIALLVGWIDSGWIVDLMRRMAV